MASTLCRSVCVGLGTDERNTLAVYRRVDVDVRWVRNGESDFLTRVQLKPI